MKSVINILSDAGNGGQVSLIFGAQFGIIVSRNSDDSIENTSNRFYFLCKTLVVNYVSVLKGIS